MLLLVFAMSLFQPQVVVPPPHSHAGRFSGEFEIEDAAQARAQAARIVTVAIDHVGTPRGVTGVCLVQGRVTGIVRGTPVTLQDPVEVGIPCTARVTGSGPRRIVMSTIREASFANLYLSDRGTLLDFEPLAR